MHTLNNFHTASILQCRHKHSIERLLPKLDAEIIIIDFHAEATSEKMAMAHYLDGKVSVVFGTHTHVQTADERILTGGTGFICDLGMTGVEDSVLGVKKEIIVDFYYNSVKRYRFEKAHGEVWFNGCIFEIDNKTGKTLSVERLRFNKLER
ncbi:MAG: YmdB family metallophosphoesterase [Clostridia bacterium]|nr:YmdB family metallophosphoesterase [Clostridia bacterium]